MAVDGVGTQAQELDAAFGELGLKASHLTQFSGADGSVVLGVGEENDPVVTNVLVQVDGTLCSVGLEVGGNSAQAETRQSRL